ncbi:hypothetical protein CJ030_MR5G025789 [Morella rubra]|uniref:BED-type domain-containing protein n=1 Tax=Morella rubra TaxID=262757 RepID=A0A6A1VMG5_9ROSI|nr:hypothetical protein CJ030_MR5G025789 [Morella rubra]
MDTPPQSQSPAVTSSSATAMSPLVSCPAAGSTPDSETVESTCYGSGRPPRPEPKKRKNSNPSDVWLHYTKVPNSDPPKAKCNYCRKDFMAHHKNETLGLFI